MSRHSASQQKNEFTITLEEYAKKGKYNINMAIADDKNDPIE
ncbi:MAG TPA: hypothetical protein PLA81_05945 [Syntrophorhabdaceae bacterium]|jgi:hypothetical protein|nr:hypothetical protein [Syntrophorhabdaceae bacterium]HOS05824.1 hypothetical protein [Syntrophorhabdaceae bacterium]HPL41119.1 hypothetical protein [Syntrophorhabdaceae bacterium]